MCLLSRHTRNDYASCRKLISSQDEDEAARETTRSREADAAAAAAEAAAAAAAANALPRPAPQLTTTEVLVVSEVAREEFTQACPNFTTVIVEERCSQLPLSETYVPTDMDLERWCLPSTMCGRCEIVDCDSCCPTYLAVPPRPTTTASPCLERRCPSCRSCCPGCPTCNRCDSCCPPAKTLEKIVFR